MNVLHIDPADEDEFTVTLRRPVPAPAPEDRAAARQGLINVLERLDERTKDIPEQEIDVAIDEAMQAIHPRHD